MSEEELSEMAKINEQEQEEQELANQEAYYWHCIAEFYGMLKVFGTKKVFADLKTFKEQNDPEEVSRIILP